jgi:hypothetical protein
MERAQVLIRSTDADALCLALEKATCDLASDIEVDLGVSALPGEFDAGLGLTSREGMLSGALGELGSARDALRGADAVVVAGTVHQVIAGPRGPLCVTFPVTRLAPLTPDAFRDYWLHEHVAIPKSIPGFHSYAQLHADDALTGRVAQALGVRTGGYDGCALVGHIDLDEFERVMAHPIFVEKAVPDMATFVDHEQSSFNLFRLLNN